MGSSCLLHFLVCYNLYATLKINKNTVTKKKKKKKKENILPYLLLILTLIFLCKYKQCAICQGGFPPSGFCIPASAELLLSPGG